MDKQKLSKLASINNEKANKFLLDFANTKKREIQKMTNNEDIIMGLDLLSAIFYRAPKVVLAACIYLLYKKKPIKPTRSLHGFKGQGWNKVKTKALELLKDIRYYELKKVIKIAFDFSRDKDKEIRNAGIKLIQEISQYNYQALPHVGLTPQNFIFDYIKKLDFEKNFNSIKVTIEQILETSADATVMTSPDTITIQKGDLNGSSGLKDLRIKTINLIFSIYKKSKENKTKNGVAHLLAHACQFPINSERNSPIGLIIQENREYIISELDKIMFDKKGKLKASLSFFLEIEHLLYWHFIFHKQQHGIAEPLYKKVKENHLYEKFSKFVHDDSLRYEIGSNNQQKENREDVLEYIKGVSENNIERISEELNLFATEVDVIGEWKFRNLQALLEKLAMLKPEIAFTLLQDAIKHKKPLSNQMFLALTLRGIRLSEKYEIWDEAVNLIVRKKDSDFIGSIPASLHVYADIYNNPVLRPEDLSILTKLTKRIQPFDFLVSKKSPNNVNYSTMNALRAVYYLNPMKIQDLIVEEIKNNPNSLEMYLHTLSIFSGTENGIDLSKWSKKNKEFFASKLVEAPVIDWHIDALIGNLCSEPKEIINIFLERIKKESKTTKSVANYSDFINRYESIPFRMNDRLVGYVVGHKNYLDIIPEIIKASRSRDPINKFNLGKLIKHFSVSSLSILEGLSKDNKVTDKNLKEILDIIYDFDGIDLDLAIKLAGYTSNENILKKISSKLHNTGVVSGEYGLANAYKSKIVFLKKYKDSKNQGVKKFVEMSIESLSRYEESSRKDADQDKEKRRINFETGI